MSCIRKLFSRKSLRSLSSETVLVTDQRGGAAPSTRGPEAACAGVGQHVDTESSCSDGNVVPRGRPLAATATAAATQRPASKLTPGHSQSTPTRHIRSTSAPSTQSAPASVSQSKVTTQPHTHSLAASAPNGQSIIPAALSSQTPPPPPAAPGTTTTTNTQSSQAPALPHQIPAAGSGEKQTLASPRAPSPVVSRAPLLRAPGTSSASDVPVKRPQLLLHQTVSAAAATNTNTPTTTTAGRAPSGASRPADFCSRSASCSFASLRRAVVKRGHKEEAASAAKPRVAQKQTCVVSPSVVGHKAVDCALNKIASPLSLSTPSLEDDDDDAARLQNGGGPSDEKDDRPSALTRTSASAVRERDVCAAGKGVVEVCAAAETRSETTRSVDDAAGEDNQKTASSASDAGRNTDAVPAVETELEGDENELSRVRSATAGPAPAPQRSETSAASKLERTTSDVDLLTPLPGPLLPSTGTFASASDPPSALTIGRRDSCSNIAICELSELSQAGFASAEAYIECSNEGSGKKGAAGTTPDEDGGLGSAVYGPCSWGDKERSSGAKDASRLRVFTAQSAVVAYTYGTPREEVVIPLNQNLPEGGFSPAAAAAAVCRPQGGATVTASSTARPGYGNAIVVSASLPAANLQAQQQRYDSTVSCEDTPAAGNHQNGPDSRRHNPVVDNRLNSSVSRRGNSAIANLQNSPFLHNNLAVSNHGNSSFSDQSSATTDRETNYSVSHNNSTINSSRENTPASNQSFTASHRRHNPVFPNSSVIASQQSSPSDSDGDHSSTAGHSRTEFTGTTSANAGGPEEGSRANNPGHASQSVEMEIEIQPDTVNARSVTGDDGPHDNPRATDPAALEARSSGECAQGSTPDSSGSSQAEIGPSENRIPIGGSQETEDEQVEVIIEKAGTTVIESVNDTNELVRDQSGPSGITAAAAAAAAANSGGGQQTSAFANADLIRDNVEEVLNQTGESSHLNAMSFRASDFAISFVEHVVDQIKQVDVDGQPAAALVGIPATRDAAGRTQGGKAGGLSRVAAAGGQGAAKNSDLEEAEEDNVDDDGGDDDDDDDDDTMTIGGLLDVFQLDQLCRANRSQLNSSYRRLRKEQKKTTILQQYVVHQAREQAELSRLIKMAEAQNSALKQEKKNKESELQKTCDNMEFEDEAQARKHEPLMYKKYCAAKTNAEAKTLLNTIRHRQRALHFLEAMAYRKCVALEHSLKIEMEEPEEKTKQKKKSEKLKLLNHGASPPKKPRKVKDLVTLCSGAPNAASALVPLTSSVGPPSAGSASTGTVALPSQQMEQTDGQQGQAGHVAVFGWPSTGSLAFDEVFETEV